MILFLGNTLTLTSGFSARKIVPRAYLLYSNLVLGYIFGLRSVAYCFQVTFSLNPCPVLEKFVSGAYILYYLRWESNLVCGYLLGSLSSWRLATVLEKVYLEHFLYYFWWESHLIGVMECHILFLGNCYLNLWPQKNLKNGLSSVVKYLSTNVLYPLRAFVARLWHLVYYHFGRFLYMFSFLHSHQ